MSSSDYDISKMPTDKRAPVSPPTGYAFPLQPPEIWESLRPSFEFHLWRHIRLDLHYALLAEPQRIIDVGCGYGHWAHAAAQTYPQANVLGIDYPLHSAVGNRMLPNCQFAQRDFVERIEIVDGVFDFTHMQFHSTSIPILRWLQVLHELVRITRRGGTVEIRELGMPRIGRKQFWVWLARLGRIFGLELFPGAALATWLKQIGVMGAVSQEILITRGASGMTSERLMIREGITLAEMFRDTIIAAQIVPPYIFDQELTLMRQELFRPDHESVLPIHVVHFQR